ncbi:MAG: DUF1540 domain-containing protein [Tepidanaerobacteraceae bacterium]|nr:DUF1540 domain-containing protein [Tepidanaerobacteraceae bacterium]
MARIKCNVSTCKYNRDNECCAENVMVNSIRPECTSKEGTYCDAYEKNDYLGKSTTADKISCWD